MPQVAYKDKLSAARELRDLRGIGPAMLADFRLLKVHSVAQLAREDGAELYERLASIRGVRQDPCVLDTFHCAVAQARNPDLPEEQKNWWYWSNVRKSAASVGKA